MLAFDIETTGLDFAKDHITVACVYDPVAGVRKSFVFPKGDSPAEFMDMLDRADVLCAFNGAVFDLTFIQRQWNVPVGRVFRWRIKLYDVFENCRQLFSSTFSLNSLLLLNNIKVKTGSGKEAVQMAHAGRWRELCDYCMQDTIKTWSVSNLSTIQIPVPLGRGLQLMLDQENWAAHRFYVVSQETAQTAVM